MKKMRVIIKRPDEEYGHLCFISDRLENLQKTVGGYIEVIPLTVSADGKKILLICNEEGKLQDLEPNIDLFGDVIRGTFFLCSEDGEEFDDLPFTFGMAEWKLFMQKNGVKR